MSGKERSSKQKSARKIPSNYPLTKEVRSNLVANVVKQLEEDISDRRGLKWEWARISPDVKREIRKAWSNIIKAGQQRVVSECAEIASSLAEGGVPCGNEILRQFRIRVKK